MLLGLLGSGSIADEGSPLMGASGAGTGKEAFKVADCLKRTLKKQLRSKDAPQSSEAGLLGAVQMCEKFANHSKGSQRELATLLQDVKRLFHPPSRVKVSKASAKGSAAPGPASVDRSPGTTRRGQTKARALSCCSGPRLKGSQRDSFDVDGPCIRLEALAHVRGSQYDHMLLLQDQRAKGEDEKAARARRERQAKMGESLREQLGEREAVREQRRREREIEAASVADKIAKFEKEEEERHRRKVEKAAALRKSYDGQMAQAEEKAKQAAEARAREAAAEQRQLELDLQQEASTKAHQAAEAKAEAARQQEANRQLALKMVAEAERRRQDELEYGKQYQAMLMRWEEARAANAAAFQSKSKAAFEAAGGHQLAASLQAQEKADEAKAAREQAQRAAREEAEAARRKLDRRSRELATVAALQLQIAERKSRQEEERQTEKRAVEAEMVKRAEEVEASKLAAAAERLRKLEELMEKKEAVRREMRARFNLATCAMEERERHLHSAVLSGQRPAFNYLSNLA